MPKPLTSRGADLDLLVRPLSTILPRCGITATPSQLVDLPGRASGLREQAAPPTAAACWVWCRPRVSPAWIITAGRPTGDPAPPSFSYSHSFELFRRRDVLFLCHLFIYSFFISAQTHKYEFYSMGYNLLHHFLFCCSTKNKCKYLALRLFSLFTPAFGRVSLHGRRQAHRVKGQERHRGD